MFFAKETFLSTAFHRSNRSTPLYVRINIDEELHLEKLSSMAERTVTPVIYKESDLHPSLMSEPFCHSMVNRYVSMAQQLTAHGYRRFVIAADNDGVFQRLLSPRFSSLDLHTRMQPLMTLFSRLVEVADDVGVMLTVEELAPGGLDATDGIAIANALKERGLTEIIAKGGTRDFMPLYDRRMTKKKRTEHDDFNSNEPSMASALWLLQHTDLKVICASAIDNHESAINLAKKLGFTGLIEKAHTADI
jgi:hypothetical protein